MNMFFNCIKNKILFVTAILMLVNIGLILILQSTIQQQLHAVSDSDICQIFESVRTNNEIKHIQIVEKSFKSFLNLPQLTDFLNGNRNETNELVLKGMYLSLKKTCDISHLLIIDKKGDVLLSENAKEFSRTDTGLFKQEGNRNLLRNAAESWAFVGKMTFFSKKGFLLVSTALFDDSDSLLGYIAGLIPSEVLIKTFSEALKSNVACQNQDGEFYCNTDSLLYNSIPADTKKKGKSNSCVVTSNKNGTYLSYIVDLVDGKNVVGRFWVTKDYLKESRMIQFFTLLQYGLIVAFIVVGLILLHILLTRITRPISITEAMLKDIAQGKGDLTKRITVSSNDEMGRLSHWFNLFIEKVQNIVNQISLSAEKLSTSSEKLSLSSDMISSKTTKVSKQSDQVTSIVTRTSSEVAAVSENISEVTTSVNAIAQSIGELNTSLTQSAHRSRRESQITSEADAHTSRTRQQMEQLEKASKEVVTIIGIINTIARQTNLLALNATIEAATAGDAGKGFAVVADEIKQLAKKTSEATEEIRERIHSMESLTTGSLSAINSISTIISDVNTTSQEIADIIENQSSRIAQITQSIVETSRTSDVINEKVKQTVINLSDVTLHITGVNNDTNDAAKGITEISSNILKFKELSHELQSIVTQFKY